MLELAWKYKGYIAIVVLLLGLAGYVAYQRHDAVADERVKAQNEQLQQEQAANDRDNETRRKQDEVLMRDITPAALGDILYTSTY